MSQIAIIGAGGQLGRALAKLFPEARLLDREEIDISDFDVVKSFDWGETKIIINAAAFTNVDETETSAGTRLAWEANATGVLNLSMTARDRKMILVHYSTDYVFDGSKESEYDEHDLVKPLNVYGMTKAAGELAAGYVKENYVIRTSWLIGEGKNFVRTMLGLGEKGINPKVVDDQKGRPTFTTDLALFTKYLLDKKCEYGLYHFSNKGNAISWAEFAEAIFIEAGYANKVEKIDTQTYFKDKPLAAIRPKNSGFDLKQVESIGFEIRDWREALAGYIKEQKQ